MGSFWVNTEDWFKLINYAMIVFASNQVNVFILSSIYIVNQLSPDIIECFSAKWTSKATVQQCHSLKLLDRPAWPLSGYDVKGTYSLTLLIRQAWLLSWYGTKGGLPLILIIGREWPLSGYGKKGGHPLFLIIGQAWPLSGYGTKGGHSLTNGGTDNTKGKDS